MTISSIYREIPNIRWIRRKFYTTESTKHPGGKRLERAVLQIDERGNCDGLFIYAFTDLKQERHYYLRNCIDVTDEIECLLNDPEMTRRELAKLIFSRHNWQ